jgi:hypothetical protein
MLFWSNNKGSNCSYLSGVIAFFLLQRYPLLPYGGLAPYRKSPKGVIAEPSRKHQVQFVAKSNKERQPRPVRDPGAKLLAARTENPCAEARFAHIVVLPNTHVPVVVCRSAGIWTRGQSTALGRPAAGGEPANPAKRGTRLEATTDRAFLVSAGPPKVGVQRGLSILPGVRTGHFLVQTMALIA